MSKALVVLSGGQDSTICLFWALNQHKEVQAITFDYGQMHAREIQAAELIAARAGVLHQTVSLGPILESSSPLLNASEPLEQYSDFATMSQVIGDRVEKTFVPMRNALFLVLAANRAVAMGAGALVTGVCQADGANYPDCTEVFINRMEAVIREALAKKLPIQTPLIHRSKANSIHFALQFPGCYATLALSHTAYDGGYPPTGKDHASVLRAHGFEEAGVADPLVLRAHMEGRMPLPDTANYQNIGDKVIRFKHVLETVAPEAYTGVIFSMLDELEFAYRNQLAIKVSK